jgi:hypothetical protein
MRINLPTVKRLIEALQLADLIVRRTFRVVGAYCLGPSRTEDLGYLTGRRAPTAPRRLVRSRRGRCHPAARIGAWKSSDYAHRPKAVSPPHRTHPPLLLKLPAMF